MYNDKEFNVTQNTVQVNSIFPENGTSRLNILLIKKDEYTDTQKIIVRNSKQLC